MTAKMRKITGIKKEKQMATKTKAIKVIAPPLEYSTPASLIMAAVAGKANLEQVEKLMILQERFEKRQSEKAYNKAMSEFKANPPQIIKDCQVSFKSEKTGHTTSYKYAELVNIVEKIDPELSKYGLSSTWCPKQENGKIGVTCRISHVLGHREEGTLWANADTSGSKNDIQAMGSTITYLQRYTVLPLLGLACSRDDDGQSNPESKPAPVAEIVKKQTLQDMVREEAKKHFKTPDDFKMWRVNNNLVEDLTKATELEMAKLFNYLKTKGQ